MPTPNPQPQMPDAKPKPRKSGIIIPHSPQWHQRLVAWLIWFSATLVASTIRYRVEDPHGFFLRKDINQAIYCFWHNRLALCVQIYRKFSRKHHPSPGIAGLVSASRDGALLSAIFECFGVQPVRGSSSRRGAQALLELNSWAERGYDLAITPDGPRGPRYVLADGAIILAQLTGLPLVPTSQHLHWKIQLGSWDKFQVPLPFSRCDITVGKVLQVPRQLNDDEREKLRQEFEAELRAISHD
jgi:lysophospholipid acyltransferase (LPLAT)-like uncharacterized protein